MLKTKIENTEITNCATEELNLGQTVYEELCRYVALHRYFYPERFRSLSGDYIMEEGDDGIIVRKDRIASDGKRYNALIIFQPEKLDEILRSAGFTNTKEDLEAVRKEGLLNCCEKNRLYCQEKINGMDIKMYGIWAQID